MISLGLTFLGEGLGGKSVRICCFLFFVFLCFGWGVLFFVVFLLGVFWLFVEYFFFFFVPKNFVFEFCREVFLGGWVFFLFFCFFDFVVCWGLRGFFFFVYFFCGVGFFFFFFFFFLVFFFFCGFECVVLWVVCLGLGCFVDGFIVVFFVGGELVVFFSVWGLCGFFFFSLTLLGFLF